MEIEDDDSIRVAPVYASNIVRDEKRTKKTFDPTMSTSLVGPTYRVPSLSGCRGGWAKAAGNSII